MLLHIVKQAVFNVTKVHLLVIQFCFVLNWLLFSFIVPLISSCNFKIL